MKYVSELDTDDAVNDFREDFPLTTEMEIELRRIAKSVDNSLVEYANSHISDNPKLDFTATVFWIGKKFYADADFADFPVLLDCPTLGDAGRELGFVNQGPNWEEKLIDSVDWCYFWTVRRAK